MGHLRLGLVRKTLRGIASCVAITAISLVLAPHVASSAPARNNPDLVFVIYVKYLYVARATAPPDQQDLRKYVEAFSAHYEFGGNTPAPIYLSTLRTALSSPDTVLIDWRWIGEPEDYEIGTVAEYRTSYTCTETLHAGSEPVMVGAYSEGRSLVLHVDLLDFTSEGSSLEGSSSPCIRPPQSGIMFGSGPEPEGKWSFEPKLPEGLFAGINGELAARRSNVYFTVNVDRPSTNQQVSFNYSFEPTDSGWQYGDYATAIEYSGYVLVDLMP